MKFLIVIPLLLITVIFKSCQTSSTPEKMQEQSKLYTWKNEVVAFYNVQNLFDTENDPLTNDDDFTPEGDLKWTEERFAKKIEQLAEVLFDLGNQSPMLVGFAEIENRNVVQAIAESNLLKKVKYAVAHFESEDKRGIDCALLYDTEKLRKIKQEKLIIELPDDQEFATRDILYFLGETKENIHLHVFVNHWSSRREGKEESEHKRLAAANLLKAKIIEIKNQEPDAKILIMGDFNDEAEDKSLQVLKEIDGKTGSFLNNLMEGDQHNWKGTLVHDREWFLFDQFIVSEALVGKNNMRIKNFEARIYSNQELLFTFPNGTSKPNATYGGSKYFGGYSDHLPIFLFLTQ